MLKQMASTHTHTHIHTRLCALKHNTDTPSGLSSTTDRTNPDKDTGNISVNPTNQGLDCGKSSQSSLSSYYSLLTLLESASGHSQSPSVVVLTPPLLFLHNPKTTEGSFSFSAHLPADDIAFAVCVCGGGVSKNHFWL